MVEQTITITTTTPQALNIRDGIVVQDYSNPNEVYMRLYGKPAPYVGADGTADQIFKGTGISFNEGQTYAKARDTMEAVEHTQDVINAANRSNYSPEISTLKSYMRAQEGLRLPGSGERVSPENIKTAYGLIDKVPGLISNLDMEKHKDAYRSAGLAVLPPITKNPNNDTPADQIATQTKNYEWTEYEIEKISKKLTPTLKPGQTIIFNKDGTTEIIGAFGSPTRGRRKTVQRPPNRGFIELYKEVKQQVIKRPAIKAPAKTKIKSVIKPKYATVVSGVSIWGDMVTKPKKTTGVKKTNNKNQYSAWEQIMGGK